MNRRKFITSTATAMVIPSFISISFDPEDEITDSKSTTTSYAIDNEAMLVVCKGQKLQLLDGDHVDPWSHVEMLKGANILVGDAVYEVTQTPIDHNDNIMFVPTFKLGEARIK